MDYIGKLRLLQEKYFELRASQRDKALLEEVADKDLSMGEVSRDLRPKAMNYDNVPSYFLMAGSSISSPSSGRVRASRSA